MENALPPTDPTDGPTPPPPPAATEPDRTPHARPGVAPAPSRTGRFTVLRAHARGGVGQVSVARDERLRREVALKTILPERRADADARRRFVAEAEITGQLEHPGIVPVYALEEDADGNACYVMRFIHGRTLAEAVRACHDGKAPAVGELVQRFLAVCQAVAYAHSRGVVHRDLKPSNVMLGPYGETLVVDWGLAKRLGSPAHEDTLSASGRATDDELTQTGEALGTPAYMAPEQARGEIARVDERADVFGLGGMLCAILTGGPPYLGADWRDVLDRARRGDLADAFARLDACTADPELARLAKACLAADPGDRPRDAGVVTGQLAGHLASVQERLRAAEVERAAADVRAAAARAKAAAERRARRLAIGLAATVFLAAGVFVWIEIGRQQRVAQARGEAAERLAQARQRWDDAKEAPPGEMAAWDQALELARQAAAIAAAGEVDDAASRDVRAALADLTADHGMAKALGRLPVLRSNLVTDGPRPDLPRADAEYAGVFRDGCGIDPDRPDEAAARLRAVNPSMRRRLVAALDQWIPLRPDRQARQRVAALAERVADPDPFRGRLRKALVEQDRKGLSRLAGELKTLAAADVSALPLGLLRDFVWMLSNAGANEEAVAVLRPALARYPGDSELNLQMGYCLTLLRRPVEECLGFYRAVLAARPHSASAHHSVAAALHRLGKKEDAARYAFRAADLGPSYGPAHIQVGMYLQEQGKLDAAADAYRKAMSYHPPLPEAHANLGLVREKQGQLAEAAACFRRAADLPTTAAGDRHYFLALALGAEGKPSDAVAACRQAIKLESDRWAYHYRLGNLLRGQGKREEAVPALRKAADLQPAYAETHRELASLLLELGNLPEAAAAFRRAAETDPGHAVTWVHLGVVLHKSGKTPDAVTAFRQAIRARPDYALAHLNLGLSLHKQGELPAAADACRRAAELEPTNAGVHRALGRVLHEQKKMPEAEAAFREAVEHDPKNADGHYSLGQVLHNQKKLSAAARALRQSTELRPEYAAAHARLGAVLREQGKTAEAVTVFRRALDLDPTDGVAHNGLGAALYARGHLAQAAASLRRAIELKPEAADAHSNLGAVLYDQGKTADAIATLRKALAINPKQAGALNNLGLALRNSGNFTAALDAFQRYLVAVGPTDPRRKQADDRIREVQRLIDLEKRLPDILKGQTATAREQLAFARVCLFKDLTAAAARLYEEGLAADPALAGAGGGVGHRYAAAGAAALAGSGRGKDVGALDGAAKARLRKQAHAWLAAELQVCGRLLDSGQPADVIAVTRKLSRSQDDPALAGVRDAAALAALPEEEREAWRRVWADVAALLKRVPG